MTNSQTKKLSTGSKFIFTVIIVLIIFVLFEMFLRVAGVHTRKESPFFLLLRVHEYPEYFRRHPTLFWELVPNKTIKGEFIAKGEYHINSHGFRGEEFTVEKPDHVIRICCIGNSCTFGWEIPKGNTYAELLEKQLQSNYPNQKFEVINCGVPGYTSHQGLTLLKEKILEYDPDVITLSFGWNDLWAAGKGISDKDQKILSPFIIWLQNNLANLETYKFIKYLLLEATEKQGLEGFDPDNPRYRVTLDDYRYNLMQIQETAEQNGIVPIFMTSPAPDARVYFGASAYTQLEEIFRVHEEYNNVLRKLRDDNMFYVVPIATYFVNQAGFFDPELKDYIHYNEAGHKLVAEVLTSYIKRYSILSNLLHNKGLENDSEKSLNP